MYEFKGQTALVTGAAQRIGRSIALSLAEQGMDIVVHCNTSLKAAEEVRDQIESLGRRAWIVTADLSEKTQAEDLMGQANSAAGRISVLVNNASIFPKDTIAEFTKAEFDENIQVNALSPLLLSRSFAEQTDSGTIINLLDSRITWNDPEHAAYSLSKRMLHDITRSLALEFAPRIRVNAVAPGLILPPPGEDHSYMEKKKKTVPLATYGSVENITQAILFQISNDFITGQVIFVDGGRHLLGSGR